MTWLKKLMDTYDANFRLVGQFEKNRFGQEYALIPVSHTTQGAHVEIRLNMAGELIKASVVDKDDSNTIIPCTEDSASRTSAPVPYPLFDKLQYVAGDYTTYCKEAKSAEPHANYLKQLKDWCDSPDSHPKVKSVYAYVSKGTLIRDLVQQGVLWLDKEGSLLAKWTPEAKELYGDKKQIFSVLAGDQHAAFVRFIVEEPGVSEDRLWRDTSVQNAYVRYMERQQAEKDLCFITGERLPCVDKHASRIRGSGDKSKLISANDSTGFTFRGRFSTSREAATISFEASQKAHNALKWLVERQGINKGGRIFLIWGTDDPGAVPDPHRGSNPLLGDEDEDEVAESGDSTHKEFAERIRKALDGFRYKAEYRADVVIMILDAATTGRMSVVYYRDMDKNIFLDRLAEWFTNCSWPLPGKNKGGRTSFFMASPSTSEVVFAAYGSRVDDKLEKAARERLLPCIVDGKPIPADIVDNAVRRASNPAGMEAWEWERTLGITCALVRKSEKDKHKEEYEVNLDTSNRDRNYLFGRLLAIADVLERSALGKEERRATNAVRYMGVFARHPLRTWGIIQRCLQPYQARMGTKANYYNKLLDEVLSMFRLEEFSDEPLTNVYLIGLAGQRTELYKKRSDKDAPEAAEILSDEEQDNEEE
ncbi:type I-C CRISPR-associated protein Cas8c/Csd1 [Paenibacillus sp. YN15]|uniref:type I-C CRISPR-associated protein Cas8c/Csd1 n=1 Tax=Paenibacillus sp. YN15 TaxID=1742774 RepID=UPI000DCF5124|nr:type I-C CRISPR-associated protein Cas8c/Csd1 [Paenibacillus sp. YN15]RAV01187.1 type I-C CRISPR-associated protein Cas8c/Csd1 [Paenibacillus sp. YN15]